jgi:hypothetical protein
MPTALRTGYETQTEKQRKVDKIIKAFNVDYLMALCQLLGLQTSNERCESK